MLESNKDFQKEASKLKPSGALVSVEPVDAHLLIIAALYLRRWNARASAKPLSEIDLSKVAAAPSTQATTVAEPQKGKKPVPTMVAPQPKIQIAEEDAMIKALETCANAKAGPAATKPADESLSMLFKMSVKLDQYLRENPERSTLVLFNLTLDIEKKLPPAYSFTQYLKGLLKSQPKDFRELLIDPYEKKGGKLDENAGSKAFAYARVALRSYFLTVKLLSNELLIEMEHLGEMKANRLELKPADVLRLGLLARRGVLLNSGTDDIKIPRWEPSKPAQKEAPKPGDDVIFQYPLRQKQ
jgi:hypothetical protein